MSKAAAFCTAEYAPHSFRTECEAKEGSQYHSEEGTSCTEDADCCRDVACVDSGQWSSCLAAVLRSCNVERQGIFWLASISAACHCTVKVCSSSRGYACLPGLHALSPTVHPYPPSKLSADTYWLAVYNSDDTLLYFSVRWAYLQPAALFWEVVSRAAALSRRMSLVCFQYGGRPHYNHFPAAQDLHTHKVAEPRWTSVGWDGSQTWY